MVEHFSSEANAEKAPDALKKFFEESSPTNHEVGYHFDYLSFKELTAVHMTKDGPKIEHLGMGKSDLESSAIPQEQLPENEKAAIEALPTLRNGGVCLPPTPEELKSFGPGPIGYCNYKDANGLTEPEKLTVRQGDRIHLEKGDKVARTNDGYLIIHPLPEVLD